MFEAGLLTGTVSEKQVAKPYIDPRLRLALQENAMERYLAGLTGQP